MLDWVYTEGIWLRLKDLILVISPEKVLKGQYISPSSIPCPGRLSPMSENRSRGLKFDGFLRLTQIASVKVSHEFKIEDWEKQTFYS